MKKPITKCTLEELKDYCNKKEKCEDCELQPICRIEVPLHFLLDDWNSEFLERYEIEVDNETN